MSEKEKEEYDQKVSEMLSLEIHNVLKYGAKEDIQYLEENIQEALLRYETNAYQSNKHNYWGTSRSKSGKVLIAKESNKSNNMITEILDNKTESLSVSPIKNPYFRFNSTLTKDGNLYNDCFTGKFQSGRRRSIDLFASPVDQNMLQNLAKPTSKKLKKQFTSASRQISNIAPIEESEYEDSETEELKLQPKKAKLFREGSSHRLTKARSTKQKVIRAKKYDEDTLCTDPEFLLAPSPKERRGFKQVNAQNTVITISSLDSKPNQEAEVKIDQRNSDDSYSSTSHSSSSSGEKDLEAATKDPRKSTFSKPQKGKSDRNHSESKNQSESESDKEEIVNEQKDERKGKVIK